MVGHAEGWIRKRYEGFQRRLALSVAPWFVPLGVPHITGFIVIAEDRPRAANQVRLTDRTTRFGTRRAAVDHHYDARDTVGSQRAGRGCAAHPQEAGAVYSFRDDIQTFSHAVGTVRIGLDPATCRRSTSGHVPRTRQSLRSRRQRAAPVGRRESLAHDRGERPPHRRAGGRVAMSLRIALLGSGQATAIHSKSLRAIDPRVQRWYASRDGGGGGGGVALWRRRALRQLRRRARQS
jgi:hypothetical protein